MDEKDENKALQLEALQAALEKFPKAADGLMWFAAASGLLSGPITDEVVKWAKDTLKDRK